MTETADTSQIEQRALSISKWANLFMAAAGIIAAWLSNSQALMVDGLFSLIGFVVAIIGARVSASAMLPPDRIRPFGYAAEESIFMTFRALSLLALITFSVVNAGISIASYASGGETAELNYNIIVAYFIVILITCLALMAVHRRAWKQTGQTSSILKIEGDAAMFDGLMTFAAGFSLMMLPFLKGTVLGFLVPIGDSLVVMILCLLVVGRFWQDFRTGLAELAGSTAKPDTLLAVKRAVRDVMANESGEVVDVAAIKSGRRHEVGIFWNPATAVNAAAVDALTQRLDVALSAAIGSSRATIVVSEHGRILPGEADG
jgi:divalent metal cation (Fe/Co/Zn/Cd) transporter